MITESFQIIEFLSGLLALILFLISLIAYKRERRKKLFLVSSAFFFYSIMKFLGASSVFFPGIGFDLEIAGNLLDFVVLLFSSCL
jgi:predicted membrane channel-forming protein YqfA (hemolysin III family)